MALKQRLTRLEHTMRPTPTAGPVIVLCCSCGWTSQLLPPEFHGLLVKMTHGAGTVHTKPATP